MMSIANFGTPLYGATLVCVLPRRRASFPRDGRRAAPRRAPASDDPSDDLSRDRAPRRASPARDPPAPSPPQRHAAYPPRWWTRIRQRARAPPHLSRRPLAAVRSEEVFFSASSPSAGVDPTRASPSPNPRRAVVPRSQDTRDGRRFWCSTAARVLSRRRRTRPAGDDAVMIVDNVGESLATLTADDEEP